MLRENGSRPSMAAAMLARFGLLGVALALIGLSFSLSWLAH